MKKGPDRAGEDLRRSCFRLPRRAIGELRFLLEGYDGIGFARTLDPRDGIVEIAWPASRQEEMQEVLRALSAELGLQTVARPAGAARI